MSSELLSDTGLSGFKVLHEEKIWDVGSIADGNEAQTTVTVPGASLMDWVLVSSSLDIVDLAVVGYVTAANEVSIQVGNWTGSTRDIGTPTFHVLVITNPFA